MNRILESAQIAQSAHLAQTRKNSGRRAVFHVGEVFTVVSTHPLATELRCCVALLHDSIEDATDVGHRLFVREQIRSRVGDDVLAVVLELTNPSKDHPGLMRAQRKAMDRAHLAKASLDARFVKLADRTCNINEAIQDCLAAEASERGGRNQCESFLSLYLKESRLLLEESLLSVDQQLQNGLIDALDAAEALLVSRKWPIPQRQTAIGAR